MTTPPTRARWRSWSGRLWILAAALGALTVVHAVALVHDAGQRRAAVRQTTRAAARQVAALAAVRLELMAAAAFAPVAEWTATGARTPRAAVEALVRGQREGERCRCRELLPAREFFRIDLATGAVERAPAGGATPSPLTDPQLIRLARDEAAAAAAAARPRAPRRSTAHLTLGSSLDGLAAVTVVQHDERGTPAVVYGLVADAGETKDALIESTVAGALAADPVQPAALDRSSVWLTAADVPGDAGADHHPMHAHDGASETVHPHGALEGLGVSVVLTAQQLPDKTVVRLPLDKLWMLALLLACTVVVVGIAASAARREALLARARSDFIAGVSHDLRMPLAQILLAGETLVMRRERDEAARLTLAGSIVREARCLVALVENILLYSRAGSVELRPRLEPVPVDALLADVAEAVQLAVADAGQRIEVGGAAPSDAALAVLGDRNLVRQALVNLVDNALKYGAPGQRIRLGAEPTVGAAGGMVRLLVDDQGPGIPTGERDRVFEPYERLSRDQSSERTGTGLGLAVVRQIAQACRGRVWLEDAPGGAGTRAVLELRAAEPADPVPAADPHAAGAGVA